MYIYINIYIFIYIYILIYFHKRYYCDIQCTTFVRGNVSAETSSLTKDRK